MTRYLLSTLLLVVAACDADKGLPVEASTPTELADTDGSPSIPQDKHDDVVLAFVNSPDTTFEVLDIDVGLDRRAAERIIRHRDGADRVSGTADDNPFDSIDELLSIDWVGESALELLEGWLEDAATDGALVEGVAFTDTEATLVVHLVNTAEADTLDVDLELDVRAVDGILDARPIADVYELADVPYVGPATLERLRQAVAY